MLEAFLKSSIRDKRCLLIDYDPGVRLIKPHALGRGSDGQLLLRAFQVEGASASGEATHWKLFRVDKMRAANDNGEPFDGPEDGYKKGDRAMKGGIIEEL